jgi:hypothetical protein
MWNGMESQELDRLRSNFEQALQRWVAAIQREQELLRTTTHSARSEDIWQQADFDQEDAQSAAKKAKQEYEDAVRQANFGF